MTRFDRRDIMKKYIRLFITMIMTMSLLFGLCAMFTACGDEETTAAESESTMEAEDQSAEKDTQGFDLPEDVFDGLTIDDRIEIIKENVETIKTIQKDGITDENKDTYKKAADKIKEVAPELGKVIDEGKEDGNIDTEKIDDTVKDLEKQKEEMENTTPADTSSDGSSERSPEELGTDDDGNVTLPYGGEPIELPTITFD